MLLGSDNLIKTKVINLKDMDKTPTHFRASFVRVRDETQPENFIAFIYDEINDEVSNFLMIYDIY